MAERLEHVDQVEEEIPTTPDKHPTADDFRRAAREEEDPRDRLVELRRGLPFAGPRTANIRVRASG